MTPGPGLGTGLRMVLGSAAGGRAGAGSAHSTAAGLGLNDVVAHLLRKEQQ